MTVVVRDDRFAKGAGQAPFLVSLSGPTDEATEKRGGELSGAKPRNGESRPAGGNRPFGRR